MRQVKNQAKTTTTYIKATTIDMKAESSKQIVQVQSHLIYAVKEVYNSDNTNDEKVLSENCNEIDVLTVLIENNHKHEKSNLHGNNVRSIIAVH